jgi:hypothetical protein
MGGRGGWRSACQSPVVQGCGPSSLSTPARILPFFILRVLECDAVLVQFLMLFKLHSCAWLPPSSMTYLLASPT